MGEHGSCLWESSAPTGRHIHILSLNDPKTCAPYVSPRQNQANHGRTQVNNQPGPVCVQTESLALPSRLANRTHSCGTYGIIMWPPHRGGNLKCSVEKWFPYFSCLKHFKSAGDIFGKSMCSLAIYITIFLDQKTCDPFEAVSEH